MPTTVVHSIGTTGRDYSTLQAWNDACPSDLTAVDQIWRGEAYNDSGFSSVIVGNGVTADATCYLQLTAAAGQSFQDQPRTAPLAFNHATGVYIDVTLGYSEAVRMAGHYARISRFQVKNTSGFAASLRLDDYTTAQDMLVVGGGASGPVTLASYATAINILAVVTASGFTNKVFSENSNYGPAYFVACTAIYPTNLGTAAATAFSVTGSGPATNTMTSCASFGFATPANNLSLYSTASNNATGQASGLPGTSNQFSVPYTATSPFTQADATGTLDFRPVAGTPLAGHGYLDAARAPDDITGSARASAPTIGVWELTSAPPPSSSRLFSTYFKSGTSAQRVAFTPPNPPAVIWHETDTGQVYVYDQGWVLLTTASGGGGITQLTGPVTAGPGSGSQATIITPTGVTAGSYGDATHVPQLTVNAAGQVTAATTLALPAAGMTQLTGDGTAGPGSGSQALTLAASGVTAGTYGDGNTYPQVTVNAKGLVTGAASLAWPTPAETLTIATSGAVNNVVLDTTKRVHVLNFTNTADVQFSGTSTATGLQSGDRLLVQARSTGNIYLQKQSLALSAVRLFFTPTTLTAGLPVAGGSPSFAEFVFNPAAGFWGLVGYEQGVSIEFPYSAANFTADVGTWTQPAGGVVDASYYVKGRTVLLNLNVQGGSLSGAATVLSYTVPMTFVRPTYVMAFATPTAYGGGNWAPVAASTAANGSALRIQPGNLGVWQSNSGGTYVFASGMFEIT